MSLVPYALTAYNSWQNLPPEDRETLIKARNQVMAYSKRKFSGYMTAAKRRRLAKKQLGQRPQRKPAKIIEETSGAPTDPFFMKNTRTLYAKRLCNIAKNEATVVGNTVDTSDTKFKRRTDTVMLSGFKFCFEVDNTDSIDTTKPMYVNFAVLVDKESSSSQTENLGTSDFFRDLRKNKDRSIDFSTGLSSNELHCLPINTDKFGILKHKRMRLAGNNANSVNKQFRNMDFYLRCKRQLRWDAGNTYPEGPRVYAVMWCSRFGDNAGKAVEPDQIKMHGRILTYFRG